MKTAFITGITGQDGSYLAELLLEKGYRVVGLERRLSKPNRGNIKHILNKIVLVQGDILDESSLISAFRIFQPDEIYNLAAQSFVGASWNSPDNTSQATGLGALHVFDAAHIACPGARIYQASSSEMFGNSPAPQNEISAFYPQSPYGVAKIYAHYMAHVYRKSYGMFISCGICYNHESPRRGVEFVTRKITRGIAEIIAGKSESIRLGNLDARRDWGYAPEYVKAMWEMLQQPEPDDFVIATGEMHTVMDFVNVAFSHAGIAPVMGVNIITDPTLYRPAEVYKLRGDYKKAKRILKWEPLTNFAELAEIMVDADIKLLDMED